METFSRREFELAAETPREAFEAWASQTELIDDRQQDSTGILFDLDVPTAHRALFEEHRRLVNTRAVSAGESVNQWKCGR